MILHGYKPKTRKVPWVALKIPPANIPARFLFTSVSKFLWDELKTEGVNWEDCGQSRENWKHI